MKSRGCSVTARRFSYVLLALMLLGCGKKGGGLFESAESAPEPTTEKSVPEAAESWGEPSESTSLEEVDPLGLLLEESEELAELQAIQFEQRELEMEAIRQDVEAIRKQLLLERYEKLEVEAKKKEWHKKEKNPEEAKESKRFEEWRYMQQQRDNLGLPEIKKLPIKNKKAAVEPDWRKRAN